jgi:RNA polymerase sigma-70 factor (ECF subfamily)
LKCDQFHADRKFRPWLYTIATHQAIDTRRRNRRHQAVSLDNGEGYGDEEAGRLVQVLESGETDPSDVAAGGERDRWIRQSVEQLSEPMRAVIHLVYFQGLKYREAAEVLRIPVGTVKSRLHEAIASLTEVWKDAHQVREP